MTDVTAHALDPGDDVRAVWTADTDRRRELAHFRDQTRIDFDAWGEEVWRRLSSGAKRDATWLDWGCGGGAIASAIERHAQPARYYAVDLDLGALNATAALGAHVTPLLPWQTGDIPPERVDHVLSTSCFQHFPSAEYARAVLLEMRRVCRPGASGLIQTRYYVPGDAFDPSVLQRYPYAKAFVRYCAWQVNEFATELERAGFVVMRIETEPGRQYAWYAIGVRA